MADQNKKVVPGPNFQADLQKIGGWLIDRCIETNAKSMILTLENVSRNNKPIGTWEIVIKKKE